MDPFYGDVREQASRYAHDEQPSAHTKRRESSKLDGPPAIAEPDESQPYPQAYKMQNQAQAAVEGFNRESSNHAAPQRHGRAYPSDSSNESSRAATPDTDHEPYPAPLRPSNKQTRRNDHNPPRFETTSQNRPTFTEYDRSPRPSRDPKLSGAADRRGQVARPPQSLPRTSDSDADDYYEETTPRAGHSDKFSNQTPYDHPTTTTAPYPYPAPASLASKSAQANPAALNTPEERGVGRFASVASVSTTKATRGSPPPPETPVERRKESPVQVQYDPAPMPESTRFADSDVLNVLAQHRNVAHTGPLPSLQVHSPQSTPVRQERAPRSRQDVDGGQPRRSSDRRSEDNHSASTASSRPGTASTTGPPRMRTEFHARQPSVDEQHIEGEMRRARVTDESPEPPPAYQSVPTGTQQRPEEKRRAPTVSPDSQTPPTPQNFAQQTHPALVNEALRRGRDQPDVETPHPTNQFYDQDQYVEQTPADTRPAAPPLLPEGWISHLDPNSGHVYYIHLPTKSTQWEFPKGPSPLNLHEPPLSPTGTFVNRSGLASPSVTSFQTKPLNSPVFPSKSSRYAESTYSMATTAVPSAGGFDAPPPEAGIERFRVEPSNGVYFGPYLRYTNMDIESGIWYGSVLLVTDARFPPTIHIHQSTDLSPDPRQLRANIIARHLRWQFFRYDIDLQMEDRDIKWTYAITSHSGCTRYEFLVAGRGENSWRFIAHSGNDFASNVGQNERNAMGGIDYVWRDVLQKHEEVGGFHAQLGLGNQIYADRLWRDIPSLRQWTNTKGKDNRKNEQWTAHHEEDVTHAYFHYYTSHFDQHFLREAFAQIPYILTLDDHDIFDGYGSYPDHLQNSHFFNAIGRIGIEFYLLFQHHTTPDILRNVSNDLDIFTITGRGWHFIKHLGPAVVVVGPDCRSERTFQQVIAGRTYQNLFPKVAMLPACVQHCIWMIPVPVVYPRLEMAEHLAQTVTSGKRAVTGTFNALGKVTSGLAGVVGAKGVVGDGFAQVKKAVGKTGLMSNILSPFGELDILDELRDQWTHESKDVERTYLIRMLQYISRTKSIRMTFFSGAVNACGAGWLHNPAHPNDPNTMYQIIASSIVNAPPSPYALRLLHAGAGNPRLLYVPENGKRSAPGLVSDTREDMLEVFGLDVDGRQREAKRLMGRRNYVAVVAFDPALVSDAFHAGGESVYDHGHGAGEGKAGHAEGRLSLAIDFMVQAERPPGGTVKYGPIVVPDVQMTMPGRGWQGF